MWLRAYGATGGCAAPGSGRPRCGRGGGMVGRQWDCGRLGVCAAVPPRRREAQRRLQRFGAVRGWVMGCGGRESRGRRVRCRAWARILRGFRTEDGGKRC